jgi:hypothetical protein
MANVTTSSPHRAFCLSEDMRMPNPLCFVLMPFGRKPSPIGGNHRFRCCLLTDHQARHRCHGTGSDPRRRGTGRRDHPQTDVRAADPLRICSDGSHSGQRVSPARSWSKSSSRSTAPDRARRRSGCWEGKKQIYGSQLQTNAQGQLEFYPIEDEANMDKRRQSVGLEPLAEYAKHFGLEYHSK